MEIIKKCYLCWDKNGDSNYVNEVLAASVNQAKSIHAKSSFDDATYASTTAVRFLPDDIVLFEGKEMRRCKVQSALEYKAWRANLDRLKTEKPNEKCLIYSGQWDAWWRSENAGYTYKRDEAGIYTVLDAYSSVYHCGIEKRIELQVI